MRVAFASSDGVQVDEHFGQATAFHVWEIGANSSTCVASIVQPPGAADDEDRIVAKAKALEGCVIAYSTHIGGPAAAKLVARHIHPLKTNHKAPIADLVEKLQLMLRDHAPPWLSKATGTNPTRRIHTVTNPDEE